jgi:hypothetical protein
MATSEICACVRQRSGERNCVQQRVDAIQNWMNELIENDELCFLLGHKTGVNVEAKKSTK